MVGLTTFREMFIIVLHFGRKLKGNRMFKEAVSILTIFLMINSFCYSQNDGSSGGRQVIDRQVITDREIVEREIVEREIVEREIVERVIIDREIIEREIYYRFGEFIDGVYIVDLQTQDYIDAHIQIDSRYNLDIGKILGNVTIGSGVIIITAITIPALTPALGPHIAVIVTQIIRTSLASAAINGAIEGTLTYAKTGGDTRETINQAITGASEGYKWGAIFASGAELSSVIIKTANAAKIATINSRYAGKIEPKSGVRYVEKVIIKAGQFLRGVFPEFDSLFNTRLPNNLLRAGNRDQFRYCMDNLLREINRNPQLARRFNAEQLEQIRDGFSWYPTGYTWHHNEQEGLMQLVDSVTHDLARHTGGKSIWGGGY